MDPETEMVANIIGSFFLAGLCGYVIALLMEE